MECCVAKINESHQFEKDFTPARLKNLLLCITPHAVIFRSAFTLSQTILVICSQRMCFILTTSMAVSFRENYKKRVRRVARRALFWHPAGFLHLEETGQGQRRQSSAVYSRILPGSCCNFPRTLRFDFSLCWRLPRLIFHGQDICRCLCLLALSALWYFKLKKSCKPLDFYLLQLYDVINIQL